MAGARGKFGVKLTELTLLRWRDSHFGDDEEVAIALEVTASEGERADKVGAHEVLYEDRLDAFHELVQEVVQVRKDCGWRPGSMCSEHHGIQPECSRPRLDEGEGA